MKVFITRKRILLFSFLVLLLVAIPLALIVLNLQQHTPNQGMGPSTVRQYEKVELTYPFSGNYTNPNDPGIVDVEAVFTAPNASKQTVPGFFFQDFTRSGDVTRETLRPVAGSERWKVRYAPAEVGTYTYIVTIKDFQGTRVLDNGSFNVTPSSTPGFIHAVGLHFARDNGQRFIPLGVNAPWFQNGNQRGTGHAWGDGTYGVDEMYKQLVVNGINYIHLWTCSWSVGHPAPFAKPDIGCDGGAGDPEQMSQPYSWEMDYIVNQAHAKNIYIMPILKHHNPQVFENADKIKARYFVARWGYSTNIMAWEFCKERCTNPATSHAWASYISAIDPYKHLLTTSLWNHFPALGAARLQQYDQIFSDPLMSIVQSHDYEKDCSTDVNSDSSLYLFHLMQTYSRNLPNFGKPDFIGETGLTPCLAHGTDESPYSQSDKSGIILKGEIWGTLMSSSGGYAPWYFHFDPGGAWTQLAAFKGASAYITALPPIPDAAQLFSTYQDTSQATVSNAKLRVIGRKDATFAMLYIQNTTGTWGAILRDRQTPLPVSGTIRLKGMQSGATFSVRWYDTDSGTLMKTDRVTANSASLLLTLPGHIIQSMAAIITTEGV
ncbi:MAG: hypothetical protein NVSMB27_24440 [Ktedonobacteraceae bacterium]